MTLIKISTAIYCVDSGSVNNSITSIEVAQAGQSCYRDRRLRSLRYPEGVLWQQNFKKANHSDTIGFEIASIANRRYIL